MDTPKQSDRVGMDGLRVQFTDVLDLYNKIEMNNEVDSATETRAQVKGKAVTKKDKKLS